MFYFLLLCLKTTYDRGGGQAQTNKLGAYCFEQRTIVSFFIRTDNVGIIEARAGSHDLSCSTDFRKESGC